MLLKSNEVKDYLLQKKKKYLKYFHVKILNSK